MARQSFHGIGAEGFGQELESPKSGGFATQSVWVLASASVAAAEVMVAEAIEKVKDVGLAVGAEKNIGQPSEGGGLEYGGRWLGSCVGGSVGISGVDGVSGRKHATRDFAQNSSSEQMLGEMANCIEFIMDPEETALGALPLMDMEQR